jgi:hypothetical protein
MTTPGQQAFLDYLWALHIDTTTFEHIYRTEAEADGLGTRGEPLWGDQTSMPV